MNYSRIFKYSILLILVYVSINAQNDHKNVQKTVVTLFDYSKSDNYENAAKLILYNGSDKERNLKSTINYANSKEKSQVKRICKKINSYLKISDNYEFGKNYSELEKWGIANKQEVLFKSGTQTITTVFVFSKIDNEYYLAEIN